ncbi:RHS repeat domain-containing protein [Elizabethkingia meningoseptica]|uniref:RHS repeat domain-containing protein n=1 Tax=Elizabethkingia meningoseptica TaxID=238 RepID=UPI0022F14F81|nr:RHS repeat domain-containing protein [Elizabethkingia meningoseptica]MDE5486925.1 RHS repeat protein [Elizabethkingia meningoseptica]WBS73740.1 RHS repeat protein [Elizabethkingia meningoseptica]
MKKIYCTISVISSLFYFSQISARRGSESQYNLPETIAPSPESFYRTQFGNIPMNEFRGMQNLSIPLHILKYGDISIPITLNYAKLGVKVNDIPNNVGMSWVLETGGVINRTIKSWPDELAAERKYYDSLNQITSLNTSDGSADAAELNRLITQNYVDLEVDYFNFVYPGNSGSFYLDRNLQPVLITNNKSCKVEFNNNFNDTYQFVVTDNSGIKYYFGGVNAKEETGNRQNYATRAITSFYLSKIVDTKGNEVNYQYSIAPAISYTAEKIQKQLVYNTDNLNCQEFGGETNAVIESNQEFTIKTPVVLNKISTSNDEILFNSVPSKPAVSKLNNIEIYHKGIKNNELKMNYQTKSFPGSEERFFLNKVENFIYKNNTAIKKDEFLLEYEDPLSIPNRLSYNIDYLGYYNGANNYNLLPNTDLFQNTTILQPWGNPIKISGHADRTPNFNFAKKGILNAITYPTKGKSTFEYQSITAKKKMTDPNYTEKFYTVSYGGNYETYFDFNGSETGSFSQQVKIDLQMQSFDTSTAPGKGSFIIEIINKDTGASLVTYNPSLGRNTEGISTYYFNASPDINYRIKLSIGQYCKECMADMVTSVPPKIPYVWVETEDAGIRLKKQSDITDTGNTNIRRYYYTPLENVNNPSILNEFYKPYFVTTQMSTKTLSNQSSSCTPASWEPVSSVFYYINSTPNQLASLDVDNDSDLNNKTYSTVTISHGGDNFEKGAEEKKFDNGNINTIGVLVTPSNFEPNWGGNTPDYSLLIQPLEQMIESKKQHFNEYNGKLLRSKIFKNINGTLFLNQTQENVYSKNTTSEIYNLIGSKIYEKLSYPAGVQAGATTSNLFIGYYPVASYYGNLVKTITKEYLDNVPANVLDDSSYKKLTTIISNTYTNPVHNQITTSRSISPDNSLIEKNVLYAHEKGNQKLINANMIGIPLQTTTTKDGKVIANVETKYDDPANLLPTSVLSYDLQNPAVSKTELTYDLYDNKGNILQYSEKGKPVTIIWGYGQTQPIAKLEGATYNQISAYVAAIIAASDLDHTQGTDQSEQALISALDAFRNHSALSGYQISTYTYNPLIGVTSITPPSGIREVYKYDAANRLESVKDVNGNILKEYQYRYKN